MSRIIFNLAAKSDAAGRSQNQDNFWVCPDLSKRNAPIDKIVGTDEDVELSEKGALLVVADGMGGMNAGEVASEIVIKEIKRKFSNIPDYIIRNEDEILKFIREAIIESDESIKKYAKEHKEAEGLGSTIVLLWLINGRAFCGWCGDSRIYRFNPNNELVRLSHDHSYVQSLVDEGKISEEDAFEHPDGNIITKALGDNGNKADPELRVYDVYQRDVFLLCSDGLCGLLQDAEINEIIEATCTSSKDSLQALWNKGEKVGWSDNATIDLLCIVDGGKPAKGRPDGYPIVRKAPERKVPNKPKTGSGDNNNFINVLKPYYLYILAFFVICILGLVLFYSFGSKEQKEGSNMVFQTDSTIIDNNVEEDDKTASQREQRKQEEQSNRIQQEQRERAQQRQKDRTQQEQRDKAQQRQKERAQQGQRTIDNGGGNRHPAESEDNMPDNSAPSSTYMRAYEAVRVLFKKTNSIVDNFNKTGRITKDEYNQLNHYKSTWENNRHILLGNELDIAKDQQGDIMQLKSLYDDVVSKLQKSRPEPQQVQPEENPGYNIEPISL